MSGASLLLHGPNAVQGSASFVCRLVPLRLRPCIPANLFWVGTFRGRQHVVMACLPLLVHLALQTVPTAKMSAAAAIGQQAPAFPNRPTSPAGKTTRGSATASANVCLVSCSLPGLLLLEGMVAASKVQLVYVARRQCRCSAAPLAIFSWGEMARERGLPSTAKKIVCHWSRPAHLMPRGSLP